MTTRADPVYVLDELLTRTVSQTTRSDVTGMVLVYRTRIATFSQPNTPGRFARVSATELAMSFVDSNDVTAPTMIDGLPVGVTVDTLGTPVDLLLTAWSHTQPGPDPFDPFGLGGIKATFDGPLPASVRGAVVTITFPAVDTEITADVDIPTAAKRLDVRPTDVLESGTGQFLTLTDRLFVVRDDRVNPWRVTDTFTYDGDPYTVMGVQPQGRRRYQLLQGRTTGA